MSQVDPQYWLSWAKSHIEGVQTRREQAIERLRGYLVWIWAGYTSAVGIGFTLAERSIDDWLKFWLAAGSALLIAAYGATVHALIPPRLSFHPQQVPDIVAAHNALSVERRSRIARAFALSMFAAGVASFGLLLAATSDPSLPNELRVETGESQTENAISIALRGRVPAGSTGRLWLEGPDGERTLEHAFTTFDDGVVGHYLEFPRPPADLDAYRAVISWSEDDVEHRLSRALSAPAD